MERDATARLARTKRLAEADDMASSVVLRARKSVRRRLRAAAAAAARGGGGQKNKQLQRQERIDKSRGALMCGGTKFGRA
ncbi:hypothetical protein EON68_00270 [archaeon]|nr:MAG: hypothetical protein EON68_00270 [archaeon]